LPRPVQRENGYYYKALFSKFHFKKANSLTVYETNVWIYEGERKRPGRRIGAHDVCLSLRSQPTTLYPFSVFADISGLSLIQNSQH
jgi:hypothetical protein